jgi:putative two-component system response regulator
MNSEPVRVLVVEDNADDVAIIRRLLSEGGRTTFRVLAVGSTSHCMKRLEAEGADLVLLDYRLPGEDGLTFLRRLGGLIDLPPVIVVTGQGDERTAVEALHAGAFDFLRKDRLTADGLSAAVRGALDQFHSQEETGRFDEQIMVALAAAAEGKDATTAGHLNRMAHLAGLLGQELGLSVQELQVLRCGTLLHDIGKLAVSTATLCKPAPLSDDEWEEMRQHPLVGERICGCLRRSRQVGPIIRNHHECWIGTGYPDGLAGDQIPYFARIVSVVDMFDAMSFDRPYRKALPSREVARRMRAEAGRQLDPDITAVFLDLIEWEEFDQRGRRARAA